MYVCMYVMGVGKWNPVTGHLAEGVHLNGRKFEKN